jgi:cytoskeletal protein CcmA (bactofilin family)
MQGTMQPDPTPFSDTTIRYPGSSTPVDVMRERHAANTRPVAHIGKAILVKGDITGEEDLIIEGRVEGMISSRHRVSAPRRTSGGCRGAVNPLAGTVRAT